MNIGRVLALSKSEMHTFHKINCLQINLLEGLGVEGDAHMGKTVKHRSRVAQNPNQPNLRQVHLMHAELFAELAEKGFSVGPGEMGENITVQGIPLLSLPKDTVLKIGTSAEIQITGLRNPCSQLDAFQPGLMKAILDKDSDGRLIRKAGVMGIVLKGGMIAQGDEIQVQLPQEPFIPLEMI